MELSKHLKCLINFCCSALLFVVLFGGLGAKAGSLISEKSYWDDSTQRATLEDAKAAQFKPFEGLCFVGIQLMQLGSRFI
jgi:hypothetical protein